MLAQRVELDIQAHQVPALARQHHQDALVLGAHEGLHAPVGKSVDGQHVHHAPGLVRASPLQRAPPMAVRTAPRAVAADHVVGAHGLGLALAARRGARRHGHRVFRRRPGRREVAHLHAVVRREAVGERRMMSRNMSCTRARLISTCGISEMPSGIVLHASATRQRRAFAGRPESGPVDPHRPRMTFSPKPKAWNISIERTLMPSAPSFSIGPSLGSTTIVRICGTRASCGGLAAGPGAGDQHVHRGRRAAGRRGGDGRRLRDVGVAGVEAVAMELHGVSWTAAFSTPPLKNDTLIPNRSAMTALPAGSRTLACAGARSAGVNRR